MGKLYDELLGVSSRTLSYLECKSTSSTRNVSIRLLKGEYSRLGYVTEGVTTYMGDLYLAASGVGDFGPVQERIGEASATTL